MTEQQKKPWQGRFSASPSEKVEAFTESISYDRLLSHYDIKGSIAHATMLGEVGILTSEETEGIISGLQEVKNEIEAGSFIYDPADEDIHMAIEKRLTALVGSVGGKLHTARSRNDQVALDTRLYMKDVLEQAEGHFERLLKTLVKIAKKELGVIFSGKTHLQSAQPVLFSHHLLAYVEMFMRDRERFKQTAERVDVLPLGSAAMAGTPHPIDRHRVAQLLGFSKVSENSMDSVSDRDHLLEFCFNASVTMMHFSRLSEELIIWMSPEFGYITLSDAHCTGSSIMPQKKNPDVPELIRGKTGRVYGNLVALLTMMKSLPMTYNRDMQEDKEPLFDTARTLLAVLDIVPDILEGMNVNREHLTEVSLKGFPTATDIADYLVRKNLPFRDAHHCTGKLVAEAEKRGCLLEELPLEVFKEASSIIEEDIYDCLSLKGSIDLKNSYGGTGKERVEKRIAALEELLKI